jgi:molecular chaperone DnaJ
VDNYYRLLGVPENADVAEITRAYRRLARRHHPDVGGGDGSSLFLHVREAYDVLSHEHSRRRYDDRRAAERALVRSDRRERFDGFADEVAIDFPSIDMAVDRMRDAFLALDEWARPLSAEILLSAREAFDGTVVPLEVPVRRVCSSCGGRGEIWAEPCAACDGTGEALVRHPVRLVVPPRVIDGVRFHFRVSAPCAPPTCVEVRVAIR